MDTTLRDGEQSPGVAYTPTEKLHIARLLLADVKVDRVEIASTRVSEGERESARLVTEWAAKEGLLDRVEMLGFVDQGRSVDWLLRVGGRVVNLLTKGSLKHCLGQLRQTPELHREQVALTIADARARGVTVNVYLEDWSNGVRESFEYVAALVDVCRAGGVERIYLPDTLGVLEPVETSRLVAAMCARWPEQKFEFHGHNDYGLAVANCLAALRAGACGLHTSVNGMGERTGNSSLAEVVACIHDHLGARTSVDEGRLVAISDLVATYSGKDVSANAPISGKDAFTQTAGVHADGDAKGNLYVNRLEPARFGRVRSYALGKLSGRASLDQNLQQMGLALAPQVRDEVLRRIIALGDRKHTVVPEDLPLLVADVLQTPTAQRASITGYDVQVARGRVASAMLELRIDGRPASATATGAGGYDALMNALAVIAARFDVRLPRLVDYRVRIPPGGRTEALVETRVDWQLEPGGETFTTLGVDSDQLAAAVVATEKMLNRILPATPAR